MAKLWVMLGIVGMWFSQGVFAQSEADSLFQLAQAKLDAKDDSGACREIQLLTKLYPQKARNGCCRYIRFFCKDETTEAQDTAATLNYRLMNQLIDNSLVSTDPKFNRIFQEFSWTPSYNEAKWILSIVHQREGQETEAVALLKEIVAEELESYCPDRVGFQATTSLAGIALAHKDYQATIAYLRLTEGKLHEQRICGNDPGNQRWVNSNMGLAYAGLGMQDSALKYLAHIAFDEERYSKSQPLLAIDSLIALLQRFDSTPVLMQLEQAIEGIDYQVKETRIRFTNAEMVDRKIECWVDVGNQKILFFRGGDDFSAIDDLSPRRKRSEWLYGQEWEYPYSKETCQALMRKSPFYLRAKGLSAEEIFPSKD